jgi:hypothetical protein
MHLELVCLKIASLYHQGELDKNHCRCDAVGKAASSGCKRDRKGSVESGALDVSCARPLHPD